MIRFILKGVPGSSEDITSVLLRPLMGHLFSALLPLHRVFWGHRLRLSTNCSTESHVIAGLDEKRVFHIWDPVLGFSQKKVHKEEEGRPGAAAGCGQRVSAVQVKRTQLSHKV